jgi:hypothetical protein
LSRSNRAQIAIYEATRMNREELRALLSLEAQPLVTIGHDPSGVTVYLDGRPQLTVPHARMIRLSAPFLNEAEQL